MIRYNLLLALMLAQLLSFGQNQPVFFSPEAKTWAQQEMQKMPIEDRIGQLFMIAAYSNLGEKHQQEIENLIREEKIGGLIFMQGEPFRQANLTNRYQNAAETKLLIGMDAEWDLAMRLDSTFKFPWAMTMGAVEDSVLIYKTGFQMGLHAKRLGVHMSFSPVLDINTNPQNPIINARSFGENRERVTAHGLALMQGLQDAGVLACGKHFPGHGDTQDDSHKTLPTVPHDSARLKNIELFPYQKLMDNGLASVMVAHLSVPALDASGKPVSLSKNVVTDLLQKQMNFKGIIITDALNMRGVSDNYPPGLLEVEALKAGNDILLFSADVPKAKAKILEALANEEITEAQINARVEKILMAKYAMGLNQEVKISKQNLYEDLNDPTSDLLKKQIMENALTVLINRENTLPIKDLANNKIACVQLGKPQAQTFPNVLKKYTKIDVISAEGNQNELLQKLTGYDLVLVSFHTDDKNPWRSYKPSLSDKNFLKKLALQNKFILTVFANPYALSYLPEAEEAEGLIMAYQNNKEANQAAAELIFGGIAAHGTLPVSASKLFDEGYGQRIASLGRLRYGLPQEQGFDAEKLNQIDNIAEAAIAAEATPGCQVLVARNGQVIFQKNYGFHTYKKNRPVTDATVYDLASITKISATLPMVMKLYQEGKINLDDELGAVYPPAIGTNKEHLRIRDILAHQSGLQPWIPFYLKTLKNNLPDPAIYSEEKSEIFNAQVTQNLYIRGDYKQTMLNEILASPLRERNYKYSDLGYYLFKEIIEESYKMPLEKLVMKELYQPLGASSMGYHPLERAHLKQIPPTENDKYFRFEIIQGTVHDQGASMTGGVGGHAGNFSSATDLAKLMQMYLNYGEYGGQRYLDSAAVAEFIRCQFCEDENRRGAGFDKPQLSGAGPACDCVSMLSFGHTGFTGTIAWADPEQNIVYIFLSNRTWPDAENRKLIRMNTRTQIQEAIYNAIIQ